MTTDTFNRTMSYGLGTGPFGVYAWTDRDSYWYGGDGSDSLFYCDGSNRVVIPGGSSYYDSYIISNFAPDKNGVVQFDVFLPVLNNAANDWFPAIVIRIGWSDADPVDLAVGQDYSYDGVLDPHVLIGCTGGTGLDWDLAVSVPVDTPGWYTAKCQYDATTRAVSYKLWPTGTSEPAWQAEGTTTYNDGYGDVWVDFWNSGNPSTSYFTNLTFAEAEAPNQHSLWFNSVVKANLVSEFPLDSEITQFPPIHIDALIVDGPLRHFYDRDHRGTARSYYIELDEPLGPFGVGYTLHEVLVDLIARVPEASELLPDTYTQPTPFEGRHQHRRLDDHYGFQQLSTVVLRDAIDQFPAGTSVQEVLEYLYTNVANRSFTFDAVIHGIDRAGSFVLYARLGHFGDILVEAFIIKHSFTIDAALIDRQLFVNAIKHVEQSRTLTIDSILTPHAFTMNAVLRKTVWWWWFSTTIDAVIVL